MFHKERNDDFLRRIRKNPCYRGTDIAPVNRNRSCYEKKCPENRTDWAEIKTSIFFKVLLEDITSRRILTDFLNRITDNIFAFLQIDFMTQFREYKREFDSADKTTATNPKDYYSGSTNPDFKNVEEFRQDFFSYYNFTKWVYYRIRDNILRGAGENEGYGLALSMIERYFQRNVHKFFIIRGDRINQEENLRDTTRQIGITNVNVNYLSEYEGKNRINVNENPWPHSGKVQCFNPYIGNYGKFMKEYEGTEYGSLLCGISGSTQFLTFPYLMSLLRYSQDELDRKSNDEIESEFSNLFLSAAILVGGGEGGHTLRETLSGFMITIIVLKHIIDQFLDTNESRRKTFETMAKRTCRNVLKNIGLPEDSTTQLLISEFYRFFQQCCQKWRRTIYGFYDYLRDINFVGVFNNELNNNDTSEQNDRTVKNTINDLFFGRIKYDYNDPVLNRRIETMFALDANRYLEDPDISFKNIIDIRMARMMRYVPHISEQVNIQLQKVYDKCAPPQNVQSIRYA